MNKVERTVKLTFTEPSLGGQCNNPDVHAEIIIARMTKNKTLSPEEIAKRTAEETPPPTVEEEIEKGLTVFARDERGFLHNWDYQVKGFFKEQLRALIDMGETKSLSKWTVQRMVDKFLHIFPRRIFLLDPAGQFYSKAPTMVTRTLRAETQQGPRVAMATSEAVPPGTTLQFNFVLFPTGEKAKGLTLEHVEAALDFGQYNGFSVWRNASYGRFTWEDVTDKEQSRSD